MSITDSITHEEIERAVRESPIIRAAVAAERERCAGITQRILAVFDHQIEDLDLPDGGCSDHNMSGMHELAHDPRCPYCVALQLAETIPAAQAGDSENRSHLAELADAIKSAERERCIGIAESHSSLVADGRTGAEHARGWTAAGRSIAELIRKDSGCYPPQAEPDISESSKLKS